MWSESAEASEAPAAASCDLAESQSRTGRRLCLLSGEVGFASSTSKVESVLPPHLCTAVNQNCWRVHVTMSRVGGRDVSACLSKDPTF